MSMKNIKKLEERTLFLNHSRLCCSDDERRNYSSFVCFKVLFVHFGDARVRISLFSQSQPRRPFLLKSVCEEGKKSNRK